MLEREAKGRASAVTVTRRGQRAPLGFNHSFRDEKTEPKSAGRMRLIVVALAKGIEG